jgi:nucleotide-binding universal stress UspA family protein
VAVGLLTVLQETIMRSLNEILLPTDFSSRSLEVARYAVRVARRLHSRITLLHVFTSLNPAWVAIGNAATIDELNARQKEAAYTQLNSFLPDDLHDVDVQRLLVEGEPAQAIAEYVAAERVDLIMMPTRGSSAFRRFLLGSVTAKVLHDVACPVWTSSHVSDDHSALFVMPRVIVCAIDPSREGDVVLPWASELAAELQAGLIVVHAIPSLQSNPQTYYVEGDLRRDLIAESHANISKALKLSRTPDAEIRVEGGSVSSVVHSAVEDTQANLLVIGRSLDPGLLGRLRTHSYTLIRESRCPVISI